MEHALKSFVGKIQEMPPTSVMLSFFSLLIMNAVVLFLAYID